MYLNRRFVEKLLFIAIFLISSISFSQHSVARRWNEEVLECIRNDFARPTVHARNLFHTSVLMYDSWAVYDSLAETFFLGKSFGDYEVAFAGISPSDELKDAQSKTLSYACYNLLSHRFSNSPGLGEVQPRLDALMADLGYDISFTDSDYTTGDAAALGNYLAEQMKDFGFQDGSNEQNGYSNEFYEPFNATLLPKNSGNPTISDPNRWQALTLEVFVDQSGNEYPKNTPDFLSPEWGNVVPFALTDAQKEVKTRDGNDYNIFLNPGDPSLITDSLGISDDYKWGFLMVSMWSSHLTPDDHVMWDISPASKGNLSQNPWELDLRDCYKDTLGGDGSTGYDVNPVLGTAYDSVIVPRGDYARVLAEYWADGPDSETPPGHWFGILNEVMDHELFERKMEGTGELLDTLEYEVKAYFTLGGAMHDAAVSSWSIKGYHDYIRPISAIRYMADQGQSSDSTAPNFSTHGIPLLEGYCELIYAGDSLANLNSENIGKIKIKSWKGPDYVTDTETDYASVGWILAENWWPYQRPSFVTPPFAGFVSGHSTFSRAAADVLTKLTGSPYFPGGLGEFVAKKNEFLVFEEGPSVDVKLQWAKYEDASNESSLSRIWGGIHPPIDDVYGREIGSIVADLAFEKTKLYFDGSVVGLDEKQNSIFYMNNPIPNGGNLGITSASGIKGFEILTSNGVVVLKKNYSSDPTIISEELTGLTPGFYLVKLKSGEGVMTKRLIID